MIRVYINGRLQDINDITITKKLPEIGSLEPSRVSAVINNTGEYKTDPNTNQIVNSYGEVINKNTEIYIEKDVDGVTKRVFTGWIDRPQLNIEKKTLQIQVHDWATILQKNKLDNRFYVDTSFDTIIKDILPASMDKTGIYTITDVIDYVFFEDMTVGEAIEKLIKSVGGRFYFDEYNKPIFDGGYKYAEVQTTQEFTETINDVRISSISQISHALQDEGVDRVTVTSETYKQQEKENYIYIAENIACETDPYPAGDDQFVAKFDDPVYYVQPLSEVEIQTNDGITLDSTFWNSQFITGTSTPKNPKEMLLKFNGGGTGQTVELLKIKGKFLRKETFVNSEGDQSEKANEKEYKPELVQNATWCNKLSQYLYREWHNRPTIQLTLSELQKAKEYKVGKKINLFMDAEDIQNRMVIHEIVERYSQNTAKVKLKLKYDAGNSFVPDAKPEIIKRPSNQPNIPEIEQDITTINQTLANIANDNKLTPDEKKIVRAEWQRIQNEYTSISNQATAYAITYSNYTTQYNTLNTYLTGLNLTADTTEDIDRATFETKFENYYIEKDVIVGKIQNRIHDEGTKDFVGATDPSTLYTLANGVIWHDTGANELKQWNATTSSWVVLRTNYDIGKIKVEGDNLYAGEIKSNALLSDNSPVSKISLDDGTFKFGDDVSANPKYIKYDSNGDLIIKGGTLEATNALLWTDIDITVTVGANGDFPNISQALEYLSKFWITHRSNNLTINGYVKILSGHTVNDYLRFENEDLGWITIISEDEDVPLEAADWEPFIRATNSRLPKIFTHFLCDGIFSDVYGIITLDNSSIQIGGSAFINKFGFSKVGTSNSQDRFRIIRNSNVISHEATYANIEKIYIKNSHWSSWLDNFQNTGYGFSIESASTCDLNFCDFTGASLHNIEAYDMSIINAYKCTFEPSLNPNVEVHNGSQVNITGSTDANPSEPLNTLTNNGIIFDTNNPVPISDIYAQRTMITQETSSSNFPTGRYVGDMLFSEPLSHLYIWNGTTWQAVQ